MTVPQNRALGHWEWSLGDDEFTWSPGARELFDLSGADANPSLKEVFGKVHEEDRDGVESAISSCLLEGSDVAVELRLITGDGATRWLLILGSAQMDNAMGAPTKIVGIIQDITERRIARAAREDHLQVLSTLFRAADQLLVGEDFSVAIREFLKIVGEAAFVGRSYFVENAIDDQGNLVMIPREEWTAPGISPCIDEPGYRSLRYDMEGFDEWKEALSSRRVLAGRLEDLPDPLRRIMATRNLAMTVAIPLFNGARWLGFVGFDDFIEHGTWFSGKIETLRDAVNLFGTVLARRKAAGEMKALEERIRKAQRFESLAVLAGGIAHDFNNLLTGILGNAGLAAEGLEPESTERQLVNDIESTAQEAARLAKQMLAFSGKGSFQLTSLDLSEICAQVVHLVAGTMTGDVMVEQSYSREKVFIEGDESEIRQAISNVLTNAAESLLDDSRKSIRISVRSRKMDRRKLERLELGRHLRAGEYAILEVEDNGRGMDAGTQRRIFDPFFTTKFTGRGLGLAAVMGIVKGHGGAIGVESAPGSGTSVKLVFPASMAPTKQGSEPPAGEDIRSWRGEGTILVVDDEESVRKVVKRVLASAGFQVICARDGFEALEIFEREGSSVVAVFLDLTMPGMDGEETLRRLQMIRPDLPVVISSGFCEREISERFPDGISGLFLKKPFDYMGILRKFKQLLEG